MSNSDSAHSAKDQEQMLSETGGTEGDTDSTSVDESLVSDLPIESITPNLGNLNEKTDSTSVEDSSSIACESEPQSISNRSEKSKKQIAIEASNRLYQNGIIHRKQRDVFSDSLFSDSTSLEDLSSSSNRRVKRVINNKKINVKHQNSTQPPVLDASRRQKNTRRPKSSFNEIMMTDSESASSEMGSAYTPVSGFVVTDTSPSPNVITLSQNDVQKAYNDLIMQGIIPPDNLKKDVLSLIKAQSVNAIMDEDYDFAEHLEECSQMIRCVMHTEQYQSKREKVDKTIEQRLSKARQELEEENEEWDNVLYNFLESQNQEKEALIKKHQEARELYQDQWRDPAMMIPFNKPSTRLLQLRKIQKSLALTKKFAEAKRIKMQADDLALIEAEDAKRRAYDVIRKGYQTLLEQQAKEIECFDEHQRRSENYILLEKMRLTEPIKKLIHSLEISQDHDTKAPLTSTIPQNTMVRGVKVSPRSTDAATPRTVKRLKDYKVNDEPPKLNLNGLALRRFAASKRPISSCRVQRVPK